MADFETGKYGALFSDLYKTDKINSLGPGVPDKIYQEELEILTEQSLFTDQNLKDIPYAKCCLSGLWLHHDFLDRSHTISQTIPNSSGSFWHGIMHRREGDYWNSKYWFRQVGIHPVFPLLAQRSQQMVLDNQSSELNAVLSSEKWDPYLYIDLCEKYYQNEKSEETILQEIQKSEWQLLFNYCYDHALGNG